MLPGTTAGGGRPPVRARAGATGGRPLRDAGLAFAIGRGTGPAYLSGLAGDPRVAKASSVSDGLSGRSFPMSARPVRLDLVLASWCPHCVPTSTDRAPELARRLGVPLRTLDIDRKDEEREADRLVHDFGDWNPDYLIPQLFLEWSDGRVEHLLTGIPGPVSGTTAAWNAVLERFAAPRPPSE